MLGSLAGNFYAWNPTGSSYKGDYIPDPNLPPLAVTGYYVADSVIGMSFDVDSGIVVPAGLDGPDELGSGLPGGRPAPASRRLRSRPAPDTYYTNLCLSGPSLSEDSFDINGNPLGEI